MQMEGGERMAEFPAPFFHKRDSRRSILERTQMDRDEIETDVTSTSVIVTMPHSGGHSRSAGAMSRRISDASISGRRGIEKIQRI